MDRREKVILNRIKRLEEAITKAYEYLENEKHADWPGFRPLFDPKQREGKDLPPHKDWVKSTFIPRQEKSLSRAEKALERITRINHSEIRDS